MINGKTLCLNMIVRNEMANLERCLNALADHIDCWVIGDTGSSDGTQDFIKSFFAARKKPGELHSLPFQNFEQARNAALDCAYGFNLDYDYLLLADADMELVVEDANFRERLEEPGYRFLQRADSGLAYWNTRLIRRNAGARYHGVTHEYIDVPGGVKELEGVWYKDHASGSNRVDKFARDIKLLSEALEQDPGNQRYRFYLAQSYRDAGRTAEAAQAYAKRAEMGGWHEEAWNARLQEARCLRKLGDEGGFVRQALAAFNMRPQRAEPLYDLARFYREKGMNDASVLFSEAGLKIERPERDILFLEDFVYTAGLQEEYSIAANYARDPARKDRGFAACNWLALNRAIPDGSRELARSNLFFYVKPASAMLASFAARRVEFGPPDGYRPLNPSVARLDQQIVVMLLTVNYEMTADGRYQTPNNAPVHARNFLLRLSDDLDIQSAAEVLPPADMPEPAFKLVLGFEDLRLFTWRGELWGSAFLRELTAEGWCEQVLARIDELGPATCRLTDWRVLRPEGPRVHEKNWMPRVAGDCLQFIYLCDPTRVVDDRGSTVTETTPAIAAKQFRGGSQLVAFDGGWLAVIHEVQWRPPDCRRFYQHRFVWFDETNTLRRVSRPFFFHKKGVEFAAGLAWHPDGQRLLISYSVADSEAWIAIVSASEVRGVLEDAEHLPSGNSARARDAAGNLPGPGASRPEFDTAPLACIRAVSGGVPMRNLALNKPALQSSTSIWSSSPKPEVDARVANNGQISCFYFHTAYESNPWWQVDLEDEFVIRKAVLYNRQDCAGRLKYFSILTSLDGKKWQVIFKKRDNTVFGLTDDLPYVAEISGDHLGRYVRVRLDGVGYLHFSECQVFGEPAGDDVRQRLIEEALRAEQERLELPKGRNGKLIELDDFTVFADQDNYSPDVIAVLESGSYEGRERWLAKEVLARGDRVIEAGTAIGLVAMTAASIVGASNVLTFDANPEIVVDAQRNFNRNGFGEIKSRWGVLKNRQSIPGKNETIDFYIAKQFWASRLRAAEHDEGILKKVQVPVFCLEDEIEAHRANVLIFDIEGGEVDLLMRSDLRGIRKIVMETHYWAAGERETDEMIRRLILDGFSIHLGLSGHHVATLRR